MGHPAPAKVGHRLTVAVADAGHPLWTRLEIEEAGQKHVALLDHEQARDLYYRLGRIVAFLDKEDEDDAVRARAEHLRRANSPKT